MFPHVTRRFILFACFAALIESANANAQQATELIQTVTFDVDDVRVHRDERYDRIHYRGGDADFRLEHEGMPQLPVEVVWFVLPPGTAVASVSYRVLTTQRLQGSYLPYPVSREGEVPESPSWPFNLVFPAEPVRSMGSGQYREYQMAKIAVWPITYEAEPRRLTVTTRMEIRVRLRPLDESEARATLSYHRPETIDGPFGSFRKWVASRALNRDDLERFYPRYGDAHVPVDPPDHGASARAAWEEELLITDGPSTEGQPVEYLIITSDVDENGSDLSDPVHGSMTDQWSRHAELVTRYGIFTVVRTLEEIEEWVGQSRFDRAATIRAYLKAAAEDWGTTYVLLAGDEAVIPTRRTSGVFQSREDMPSDRWYTRVGPGWEEFWNGDGDGLLAEDIYDLEMTNNGSMLHVHRLPARNAQEAATMIDKTHDYLLLNGTGTEAIDTDFYDRALVVAGPTHGIVSDNKIALSESEIAETLEGAPSRSWDITRLYPRFDGPTVVIDNEECLCYEAQQEDIEGYYAPGAPTYWETNQFQQRLRSGSHFVWHIEHSFWDKLGDPTVDNTSPFLPSAQNSCGTLTQPQQQQCRADLAAALAPVQDLTISQVLGLDNAVQYPNYSIVASGGSFTNTYEIDAVGEAFLRAPNGGAVAYIGQSKSPTNGLLEGYAERLVTYFCNPGDIMLGDAWFEVVNDGGYDYGMVQSAITALGSPILWVWPGTPPDIDVEIQPFPYDPDEDDEISVQVRKAGAGMTIPGVKVCLTQRHPDGTYNLFLVEETNENGVAVIDPEFVSADSSFETFIGALKPGWRPHLEELPIEQANQPLLVYSSHQVDDSEPSGDGDGMLEAGEEVTLEVTVKNIGTAASNASTILLRPSPMVYMELAVNGAYRPESIYIGETGGNPGGESEVFRVPNPHESFRVEGQPSLSSGAAERFEIWRHDLTGRYTVSATSQSQDPDTVFSGILTTQSSFENVTHNAGSQDVVFVDGDSIYFAFHGSSTVRKLEFDAVAADWCSVSTGAQYISSVAAGDSATVEFVADFLGEMDGRDELLMTVTTTDSWGASPYIRRDFLVRPLSPLLELAASRWSWGDWGCNDTTLRITPAISNYGTAWADSVVLTLHPTAGSLVPLDTVLVLADLEPETIRFSSAGFLLCAGEVSDTAGFSASIDIEVYKGERPLPLPVILAENTQGGGDCELLDSLYVELFDGAVTLTWECAEPDRIGSYLVGRASDLEGTDLEWFATLDNAASRYEVRDANGQPLPHEEGPYYFFVTATAVGGHQCADDDTLSVGPVFPSLREREGWPVLLNTKSDCAPAIGEVVAPMVAAATDVVYAMGPDGEPWLDAPGPYDPVSFDPALTPENRAPYRNYRGAATFDSYDDSPWFWMGAQAMLGHGLHLWKARLLIDPLPIRMVTAHLRYHDVPVDGPVLIPPHDQESGLDQLVFAPGRDDPYIYAFEAADGDPFGASDGSFAQYPGSAGYGALALGYDGGEDAYEIVASTTNGWLAVYPIPTSASERQDARWSLDLETYALSPPVVGDVDGDGDNDIVVAAAVEGAAAGKLFIVDEESSNVLFELDDVTFEPAVYPSLANLDTDAALEIIVCPVGVKESVIYVLDRDDSQSDWLVHESRCQMPETQVTNETIAATGPAVAVDYDFPGGAADSEPEILVGTTGNAIFAYQYDHNSSTEKLSPTPGWPLLFPDEPLTPALAQFDGEDEPWTMIVQTRDGWLHAFDLPSVGDPGPALWAMYGANSRNTLSILTNDPSGDPQRGSPQGSDEPTVSGLVPQPSRGEQELLLRLDTSQEVSIDVYDVGGRRVRSLLEGELKAGEHRIRWDGRGQAGEAVPSGVYWYRIRWAGGSASERVVLMR